MAGGAQANAVRGSAWAPLRIGVFRAMYLAVLVSNIGTWMQTVGAQWLLVNHADAAILVPLVQVMDTAPDVLLSVVGGVLADTFDRHRLLIVVQGSLVIVGAVLTGLTLVNNMPPALLLTLTFLPQSRRQSPFSHILERDSCTLGVSRVEAIALMLA